MSRPHGITRDLAAGEHRWCRCGRSADLPLCDEGAACAGEPLVFVLEEPRRVKLCACTQSAHPPFCDGTHYRL